MGFYLLEYWQEEEKENWCWDTARSPSIVPQMRQQLALLVFWAQMLTWLSGTTDHKSQRYSGVWFLGEIFMAKVF